MITKEAYEMNRIIRESEEYRSYQSALKAVREESELYEQMNAFRKRNYELQLLDDGKNHYEDLYSLAIEYEKVLRTPVVNKFLIAEQILSKKLTEVYEIIAEDLELDYAYME